MNASILRRAGRGLIISFNSGAAAVPQPWQACAGRLVLDLRHFPDGAHRDVRDVRRAAAAAQVRHRGRRQNGAYYRFAQEYAEELRKDGLSVEVRETAGSVENLRLLGQDGSGVAVALVQSGVAGPEEVKHFYALGSLYHEPLWVFYRGDEPLERLGQLAGKRIGVGPAGSGTHAIAMRLLAVNGLIESVSSQGSSRAVLVEENVAAAAAAVRKGELDAAFFVAGFEADYIQGLLGDRSVSLLNFDQHEAYHRRFRFLAPVTVPAGMANLGENIPGRDVALLAPTAMLVVRKDFHPALVPLLLATATRIHGKGDELSDPGEFPSESYCDFRVSEDAKRFLSLASRCCSDCSLSGWRLWPIGPR